MWAFCVQSLFREYGRQFLKQVAVPHPVRTTRAVLDSGRLDLSGNWIATSDRAANQSLEGARTIVGVGFCLKPMNPPCPSGRANHACLYLEHLADSRALDVPVGCEQCTIREIGILTLKAGAAFYIMTSAKDVLFDIFTPALTEGRFSSGLFLLCRYSLRPFAVGLLASGIRGWLFPFEQGDCRDYRTWLRADRGIKDEQTTISERNQRAIVNILASATTASTRGRQFQKRGNILYPHTAGESSPQAANARSRTPKKDCR